MKEKQLEELLYQALDHAVASGVGLVPGDRPDRSLGRSQRRARQPGAAFIVAVSDALDGRF